MSILVPNEDNPDKKLLSYTTQWCWITISIMPQSLNTATIHVQNIRMPFSPSSTCSSVQLEYFGLKSSVFLAPAFIATKCGLQSRDWDFSQQKCFMSSEREPPWSSPVNTNCSLKMKQTKKCYMSSLLEAVGVDLALNSFKTPPFIEIEVYVFWMKTHSHTSLVKCYKSLWKAYTLCNWVNCTASNNSSPRMGTRSDNCSCHSKVCIFH